MQGNSEILFAFVLPKTLPDASGFYLDLCGCII